MATFEDVKRAAKDLALLQHRNDTDEMLREVIKRSGAQILSNTGLTDADLSLKSRLSGEVDGCVEILRSREKANEEREKKAREWNDRLPERKAKAILNLPNAASPNGQLVAAILEEAPDGLTEQQLASWCDELAAIPEEEFRALLDGLVGESILEKQEDERYRLLSVLDEDMLPAAALIRKKLEDAETSTKALFALVVSQRQPISIHEIKQLLGEQDDDVKDFGREMVTLADFSNRGLMIPAFKVHVGNGIRAFRNYYAQRLLGEEDDDE